MSQRIVIASGKGGVGKSTVAVSLARALAQKNQRVLLFDFDISLRSLDVMLGVSESMLFDWGDILLQQCTPNKAFIPVEGLYFITAPLRSHHTFTSEKIDAMLKQLDPQFDFILLDAPAGLSQGFTLASRVVQTALIVATPDAVCVRSAAIAAREAMRGRVSNCRLLLNRVQQKQIQKNLFLNIDESIDATGLQLLGVVPEDPVLSTLLPQGKRPPKNTPSYAAFARIADRLCGQTVALPTQF